MFRHVFWGLMIGILVLGHWDGARALDFKIATLSPDGSSWMVQMREGAAEVTRRTDGRVRFKFYPGGVMGDDNAVLRKIRIGQLQGAAFTSGALERFYPDNKIYNLPIKFDSFEQIDYVRERMDAVIMDGFRQSGFVTFGLVEGGFAYIMSQDPVNNLQDLRNQKVWMPKGDVMGTAMSRVFGITPIPLTIGEVRTGLQTGLINTVTTVPIGAIALQWHTQVKYLFDAPLIYVYGFLTIEGRAFAKLSPQDQAIVNEVMQKVMREIDRQNRLENIKALEVLHNQGIQFIKPAQSEFDRWREFADDVTEQLISAGDLSRQMVEQLESHLKSYNQTAAAAGGS